MGYQYEWLTKDFRIYEGVVIPAADCNWWANTLKVKTAGSRQVWTESTYRRCVYSLLINHRQASVVI